MIETADAYYTGRINKDECEKVIAGHSLETGQVGKRKADIRFSDNTNAARLLKKNGLKSSAGAVE